MEEKEHADGVCPLTCSKEHLLDYDVQVKVKVIPQQVEVAQRVPGRLRPWIFLTFGTTRAVGRQPYSPVAFTTGEIPGTHFQRLSRPHGTWFRRGELRKKSPVTTLGIDPGTVAQCLNHYATPGPDYGMQNLKMNFIRGQRGNLTLLYHAVSQDIINFGPSN